MDTICCGFIGLGLIGGSIAKALKKNKREVTVYAYDTDASSLRLAKEEGTADVILEHIGEQFSDCHIVFLCAPVSCNGENLRTLTQFLSRDCVLTDVGSVKTPIHRQVAALGLEPLFIGGHPMAGSERYGYANAKPTLLENAYYILTPTKTVPKKKLDFYADLVKAMGAIPLILSCQKHDYVTAAVSHLPHVIASCLVNLVRECDTGEEIMKRIAAGGFKDITRIASSSSDMWQQICLENRENICALLSRYIETLQEIKGQIEAGGDEEIYDFFSRARIYRDSFSNASSGPIKKSFSLQVDIADEPGALASIATMLALRGISIKNIGITHNREFAEGALSIEFYRENDLDAANALLKSRGYGVHKKE